LFSVRKIDEKTRTREHESFEAGFKETLTDQRLDDSSDSQFKFDARIRVGNASERNRSSFARSSAVHRSVPHTSRLPTQSDVVALSTLAMLQLSSIDCAAVLPTYPLQPDWTPATASPQ
jgi:hypothetical protein